MEDFLLRILLIGIAFVIMRAGWTQWNLRRMLAERLKSGRPLRADDTRGEDR